jgi:hypothetical protein
MAGTIDVIDRGQPISFSFEDVLKYHGPGSPGGVAHAFKVLERALPLLDLDVCASVGRSSWRLPSEDLELVMPSR